MFRKFLYELLDMEVECKGEMHYEIEFPEVIQNDEQMCKDLLEDFEDQVRSLAWKMGLKLNEK
jgi:hypothetical protein